MVIDRIKLKEILDTVKYGLAGKDESLVGSTSFYFAGETVYTFNDSVSVSCPVPEIDFEGEVNATELLGFISRAKGKEVTIVVEDSVLMLTSGKATAGLALKEDSTLPIDSIGEISKWEPIDAQFLKAISFVRNACGKDFTRPILTCVHVAGEIIEGSDGYRVAVVTLPVKVPVNTFLLPAVVVPYVIAINPTFISLGTAWVHFKTENDVVLSCRIFEDTFVDTTPYRKHQGQDIVFPDNILEILNRAIVFNSNDAGNNAYVQVDVAANKIEVSSKSETGWFKEKAKIDYKGDELSFMITVALLQDILKQTKTAKYAKTILTFSFDNHLYVTMLRVKTV